ncbi:MAG: tetratricopeptide repeat protein [Planctomycetota bacterium]
MVKNLRVRRDKLLNAAEGYLMLEMPQHALECLDAIIDPERAQFASNYLRGMVLRQMGDHQAALDAFDVALEEQPEHMSLLLAMAWCYKRTDRLERAITAMEQAYAADPTEPIVLYNLACYWSLAGNKSQALSWLGRALRMDGDLKRLISDEQDFDRLRSDPDFELLVGMAGAGDTPTAA